MKDSARKPAAREKPAKPSEPGPPPSVIKLGGEAISPALLPTIAAEIATYCRDGGQAIVLYDAEFQLNRIEEAQKAPGRYGARRRIMDAAAIGRLEMALGQAGFELCAALAAAGAPPAGLSMPITAERRPPRLYGGDTPVDLGLSGDAIAVDTEFLRRLLSGGRLPVLPCLGLSETGVLLRLPFDATAHLLAREMGAGRLVLLGGITDGQQAGRKELSLQQAQARLHRLRDVTTVHQLRLSEACLALELGAVRECIIASFTGKGIGGGTGATVLRA